MDRKFLRSQLRNARQTYVISKPLFHLHPELERRLSGAHSIGLYAAMGAEPGISDWAGRLGEDGKIVAFPRLATRDAPMEFARWTDGDALTDSGIGFRQPSASAAAIAPDLILTPLLGFDRAMNRLGQGAGHYDRYFAKHPNALRVGIGWAVQELPEIPAEPWDVPLDAVCTDREWICPPASRMAAR